MSEFTETRIKLDVGAWMDSPQEVIDTIAQAKSGSIVIDAEADSPIGAQIAQLLLSMLKTASDEGGDLRIVNASAEFRHSIETLGLQTALGKVIQ